MVGRLADADGHRPTPHALHGTGRAKHSRCYTHLAGRTVGYRQSGAGALAPQPSSLTAPRSDLPSVDGLSWASEGPPLPLGKLPCGAAAAPRSFSPVKRRPWRRQLGELLQPARLIAPKRSRPAAAANQVRRGCCRRAGSRGSQSAVGAVISCIPPWPLDPSAVHERAAHRSSPRCGHAPASSVYACIRVCCMCATAT